MLLMDGYWCAPSAVHRCSRTRSFVDRRIGIGRSSRRHVFAGDQDLVEAAAMQSRSIDTVACTGSAS